MSNNEEPHSFRNWLVIALAGLFITAIIVGFFVRPPEKHYLDAIPADSKVPFPDKLLVILEYEANYFNYLASITAGTIAVLLAFILSDREHVLDKRLAWSALVSLTLALALVTVGYASRNLCVCTHSPIPNWFVWIEFLLLGPLTTLSYIVGVIGLVKLVNTRLKNI